MGSKKGRGSNRNKTYIEERDRIEENFCEICKYGKEVGIEITEDNISWDSGYYALDLIVNCNIFRIENYGEGYVWLHMNTAGNGFNGKKARYHSHGNYKSYHNMLRKMADHHSHREGARKPTKANHQSRKLESLFDSIKK